MDLGLRQLLRVFDALFCLCMKDSDRLGSMLVLNALLALIQRTEDEELALNGLSKCEAIGVAFEVRVLDDLFLWKEN